MRTAMLSAVRVLTLVTAAVAFVVGCEKGPAERAGEAIDRGVQKATDALDPAGPAEKAGRAVDRAVKP
jgi:hypothetical protein